MKYAEFVKKSHEYRLMSAEAKNPASGYLLVGKDGVFTEILYKLFLSEMLGISALAVESNADIEIFEGKFAVADAERIAERAYYTPINLQKKFFVIKCGENINEAAQNKLLKILEEPPRSTGFILITKEESFLLPTVRSRLKTVRCRPMAEEDINELCAKYLDNSFVAAALSGGNIERAEKFSSAEYAELYREVLVMLLNMKKSGDILSYASVLNSKREMILDVLDIIETVLHDCMMCSLGIYDGFILKMSISEIKDLSSNYGADTVLKLRPVIDRARKRLTMGGNVASVIDEVLFSILEVKAKCQKL